MGQTVAGNRVYSMRVPDARDSDAFPGIYVYTTEEQATPQNANQPREYWVDLKVEVSGVIQFKNRDAWAEALDAFWLEMYNLLPSHWPDLDSLKHLVYNGSTTNIVEAEVKLAVINLDYTATYQLESTGALSVNDLHALKTIYNQYNLTEHTNGQIEAEDRIDISPV